MSLEGGLIDMGYFAIRPDFLQIQQVIGSEIAESEVDAGRDAGMKPIRATRWRLGMSGISQKHRNRDEYIHTLIGSPLCRSHDNLYRKKGMKNIAFQTGTEQKREKTGSHRFPLEKPAKLSKYSS